LHNGTYALQQCKNFPKRFMEENNFTFSVMEIFAVVERFSVNYGGFWIEFISFRFLQ
jgi:hypothetical protein